MYSIQRWGRRHCSGRACLYNVVASVLAEFSRAPLALSYYPFWIQDFNIYLLSERMVMHSKGRNVWLLVILLVLWSSHVWGSNSGSLSSQIVTHLGFNGVKSTRDDHSLDHIVTSIPPFYIGSAPPTLLPLLWRTWFVQSTLLRPMHSFGIKETEFTTNHSTTLAQMFATNGDLY